MRYTKLGSTGLEVSPIALGAMTYGEPGRGYPAWSLTEEDSRPLIEHAVKAGINFFDTANWYSLGSSEEILGRALKDYADRDNVVVCTKIRHAMRPGPNGQGLSRKAIMAEIDHSLRRLGTDYVDIYMIHRPDYQTPVEETLEALHDVVKASKSTAGSDPERLVAATCHGRASRPRASGLHTVVPTPSSAASTPWCSTRRATTSADSWSSSKRISRHGCDGWADPTCRTARRLRGLRRHPGAVGVWLLVKAAKRLAAGEISRLRAQTNPTGRFACALDRGM